MTDERLVSLGVVLPAANSTLESELPRWVSTGSSWHFQRFQRLIREVDDLGLGADAIIDAARVLRPVVPRAIGVGYTAGSFVGGPAWDRELRQRIEEACEAPAATAAWAIDQALRHLGARAVAAVSPYAPAVNQRLRSYLEGAGYDVWRVVGEPPPGRAGEVPLSEIEQMVADLEVADADVVLISCTGLRTMALIPKLEGQIGRPVVSSNQALAWAMLRAAGTSEHGPGRLFSQ